MKTLLPILLLLASCGSKNAEEDAASNGSSGEVPAGAAASPSAEESAALQAKVSRAMAVVLPGAGTAEYRNVRAGAGGAACGEVATAGKEAGIFRPFIVTPDGLGVVASGPAIAWDDPNDFVADAWIRWCATPEELARLGPQLQNAAVNSAAAAAEVPAAEPDLPLPPVRDGAPLTAPPPEASPPPQRKEAPPPPPRIDSFFNSVDRSE
jgi:hypothetical protein